MDWRIDLVLVLVQVLVQVLVHNLVLVLDLLVEEVTLYLVQRVKQSGDNDKRLDHPCRYLHGARGRGRVHDHDHAHHDADEANEDGLLGRLPDEKSLTYCLD